MSDSKKVVIIGHRFPDIEQELKVFRPTEYILQDLGGLPVDEVKNKARDAVGILVGSSFQIDREFIEGLENCHAIVRYGIGVDNVDVEAAKEKSIEVGNVPDYCIEEVSNHAISMLLALHRRLFIFDHAIRNGRWKISTERNEIYRLSETTLGLIGMGRIGREVAKKAKILGLNVIAYDPYLKKSDADEIGVEACDLEEVLRHSDFISLHAPLTPETKHLISYVNLNLMKKGAYVINVARGGLIDQKALIEALESGDLAGAALDVFENEPITEDDPILKAPNTILTPHVAWTSVGARRELQEKAATCVLNILDRVKI